MMKVAINTDIGGFRLSNKAFERLIKSGWDVSDSCENKNTSIFRMNKRNDFYYFNPRLDLKYIRTHPRIIEIIEELGSEAQDNCEIKIVEIPDDIEWYIDENEMGCESVHEKHRIWD